MFQRHLLGSRIGSSCRQSITRRCFLQSWKTANDNHVLPQFQKRLFASVTCCLLAKSATAAEISETKKSEESSFSSPADTSANTTATKPQQRVHISSHDPLLFSSNANCTACPSIQTFLSRSEQMKMVGSNISAKKDKGEGRENSDELVSSENKKTPDASSFGRNVMNLVGVVHDISTGFLESEAVVQFILTTNTFPLPVRFGTEGSMGRVEEEAERNRAEEEDGGNLPSSSSPTIGGEKSEKVSVEEDNYFSRRDTISEESPMMELGKGSHMIQLRSGLLKTPGAAAPVTTTESSPISTAMLSATEIASRSKFARLSYDKDNFTVRCFGAQLSSLVRQQIAEGYVVHVVGQFRLNRQVEAANSHVTRYFPYVLVRSDCGEVKVLNGSKKKAASDNLQREIEKTLAEGAKQSTVVKPASGGGEQPTKGARLHPINP